MTPCWLHWTTAFPHADDPQNGLFVAHGLEAVPDVEHRVWHIKADQTPGTAPLPAGPWKGVCINSPGGWRGLRWKSQSLHAVRFPVDAVLLHLPNPDAWPLWLWAKMRGIPVGIVEHRSAWLREFPNKSRAYKWFLRALFNASHGVAVPSEFLGEALRKAGVKAPITVLGNPLPAPTNVYPRTAAARGHRFGHLGDSVGSIKGQEFLLEAWALHAKTHPNDTLELRGNGPDRAHWEQRWGHLPGLTFGDGVPREDVERAFSRWDTLVINSPVETFGLAAAEALDRGCAVLSTQNGGVSSWGTHLPGIRFRTGAWNDVPNLVEALELCAQQAPPSAQDREKCRTFFEPLRPKFWGADFSDWVRRLKPTLR
jgi:glycosyltransferase involved in cell wall biosynthesis